MDNNENVERIIDVTEIKTAKELQEKLKKELDFPEFYGMNWDAFWDTITGLVELPERLMIKGWDNIVITTKHIQAQNSGHFIHLTEPELISVGIDWIEQVARNNKGC